MKLYNEILLKFIHKRLLKFDYLELNKQGDPIWNPLSDLVILFGKI